MKKENNNHKPAGQRRTTNRVSDLGQVALDGHAQTEEPLKVEKVQRRLSSAGVGARRFLGRLPASSGVGRRAGGARTLAPVYWNLLHSREIAHRVPLSCLPASSAGLSQDHPLHAEHRVLVTW